MSAEVDVIVIGAGAAGLAAARELSRRGCSVTLLEAANRIGGRAFSEEFVPGEWFDHGCAWLVGGETNPFTPIATEHGLSLSTETRPLFTLEHTRLIRNGRRIDAAERKARLAYYEACETAIAAAAEEGRDVPLSAVIPQDPALDQPFRTMIDVSWGDATTDRVSTIDHGTGEGDLGYRVHKGLGTLVAIWGADMPVSLNVTAERIDWSGPQMKVITDKGTLTAKTVLITVSTGVLADERIRFHPPLPDWKQEAINDLPMITENKVGLYLRPGFITDADRAYHATWTDDGLSAKVDTAVTGGNTAVVLFGGPEALSLEKEGPAAMESFATDRLSDIFGSNVRKDVRRSIATGWKGNQATLGSWAAARPGRACQRKRLAQSVDDRFFFAGEATMTGSKGTCHGAYFSGLRAAREIADKIAPAMPEAGLTG